MALQEKSEHTQSTHSLPPVSGSGHAVPRALAASSTHLEIPPTPSKAAHRKRRQEVENTGGRNRLPGHGTDRMRSQDRQNDRGVLGRLTK